MSEHICKYCGTQKITTTVEAGMKVKACTNYNCPMVRYQMYAHQGGCGIRSFAYFTDAAGQLQQVEVPPDFKRPENWDGKPPKGFTPPLAFAQWQAAGEPERWEGGVPATT